MNNMTVALSARDETEDLVLDCVIALIGAIPYAGGVLSTVFSFFTSASAVISWEDIEDYVDAEIDRKLLEADIQRAREDLDNIRTSMASYSDDVQAMTLEERERSKDDYYLDLKRIEDDLLELSKNLLGREGYPDKQEDGLWRRAPYALVSTVGEMLVIHASVLREMQAEIYARDAEYVQNKLDDALSAYLAAAWILLPKAYEQRMAGLRYIHDERTEEYDWAGSFKQTTVTYLVEWSDDWIGKKVKHSETKAHPNDAQEDAYIARMNDARNEYQSYWLALNQSAAEEIDAWVVQPLTMLISLARNTVQEAERKRRAETGQTFGGVKCRVAVRAGDVHTPQQADVDLTLYVAGEQTVPAMASQKLEEARREMWSWCVRLNAEAELAVQFGVWAYGKFDSTWNAESDQVSYAPGTAPVAAVSGVNGKYEHLSISATWEVPE